MARPCRFRVQGRPLSEPFALRHVLRQRRRGGDEPRSAETKPKTRHRRNKYSVCLPDRVPAMRRHPPPEHRTTRCAHRQDARRIAEVRQATVRRRANDQSRHWCGRAGSWPWRGPQDCNTHGGQYGSDNSHVFIAVRPHGSRRAEEATAPGNRVSTANARPAATHTPLARDMQ